MIKKRNCAEEDILIKTLEDFQMIEKHILDEVNIFCIDNGLRYYLVGGTLLGAVRHKGFIPWDDDIDIAMYRSDYEKLVMQWNSERYKLLKPGDDNYYYNFAKLIDSNTVLIENGVRQIENMGVYIDIFILDEVGCEYHEAQSNALKLTKIRKEINTFAYCIVARKNPVVFLKTVAYSAFNFNSRLLKLQKKYIDLTKTFINKENQYVLATGGAYGVKDIFLKDYFGLPKLLEFEKSYYMCPSNYEDYLSQLYGDYMKMPPKEKRISHHSFFAYWKKEKLG